MAAVVAAARVDRRVELRRLATVPRLDRREAAFRDAEESFFSDMLFEREWE